MEYLPNRATESNNTEESVSSSEMEIKPSKLLNLDVLSDHIVYEQQYQQ